MKSSISENDLSYLGLVILRNTLTRQRTNITGAGFHFQVQIRGVDKGVIVGTIRGNMKKQKMRKCIFKVLNEILTKLKDTALTTLLCHVTSTP